MDSLGLVTIAPRAMAQIASYFARNCEGVAEMTDISKRNDIQNAILGRDDVAGAYVKNTKDGVAVDVYLACYYGADTEELKARVESEVREAYAPTGVKIKRVDAHINSVK